MRPLLNLETLWTQALGGVPALHLREGCDPHVDRGQRPASTVAQELTSTPRAACPGLALGLSVGRALANRALGSGSEQRLDECLLIQACPAGIGCCTVRSPRPPAGETLAGRPRDGADGDKACLSSKASGIRTADSGSSAKETASGRHPEPASRTYLGHLGCGVAPGPHEDHGQGRGDA